VEDLTGARIVEIRRVLNMAVVGFARDDEEFRLHAQCPFRLLIGDRVLLGTKDMWYRRDRDMEFDVAWDTYATVFDKRAEEITSILASEEHVVASAEVGAVGLFTVEATTGLHIDVLPDSSSKRLEMWRLFARHDIERHFVYPPEVEEEDD